MERTGTNGQQLIALLKRLYKVTISPTLLSFLLRGSRRWSGVKALAVSDLTGVPVETLTRWPQRPRSGGTKLLVKRPRKVA